MQRPETAIHSPDYLDSAPHVLPSFASIRNKTLQTLYGDTASTKGGDVTQPRDKSPKGSVDEPIQSLVNVINDHPSFATLSSCSGRIALFDPAGSHPADDSGDGGDGDNGRERTNAVNRTRESGKGGGRWLLVSHKRLVDEELVDLLPPLNAGAHDPDEDKDQRSIEAAPALSQLLSFRFEPMLLHVAAATLGRGQQLLQLVLQLGFRESGLVVTSNRVTVAIRSYSLALVVPLARSGPMRLLSDAYLRGLVQEANRRLDWNLQRIDRLCKAIENSLFQHQAAASLSISSFAANPLPNLNLWGHTAVSVRIDSATSGNENNLVDDILVFGGYGTGPEGTAHGENCQQTPKRSDKIYRLRRRVGGHWSSKWEQVDTTSSKLDSTQFQGGNMDGVDWFAREGAASCTLSRFQSPNSVGLVYGGRKGPAHPLNDLVIFEYHAGDPSFICFYKPTHVIGKCPGARWGHSLTALSGRDDNQLAVLVGGRNAISVLDDCIHVLSVVALTADSESSRRLQWQQLILPSSSIQRFHHSSVALDDTVFVFGGLSETNNLLESFSEPQLVSAAFTFTVYPQAALVNLKGAELLPYMFGQKACLMTDDSSSGTSANSCNHRILLSGGLMNASCSLQEPESWSALQLVTISPMDSNDWELLSVQPLNVDWTPVPQLGPLVHHDCIILPGTIKNGDNEKSCHEKETVCCVGGGVAGFAFSPYFSKSVSIIAAATMNNHSSAVNENVPQRRAPRTVSATAAASASLGDTAVAHTAATEVVYVKKQNAKSVKTQLEELVFLNKTYRMGPADPSSCTTSLTDHSAYIAVPITSDGLLFLEQNRELGDLPSEASWVSLVEGTGKQVLSWSTAVYASRSKTPRKKENDQVLVKI